MKRKEEHDRISLSETIPEVSLDIDDIKELQSIFNELGFKELELQDVTLDKETTMTAPLSKILQISSLPNQVRLPIIFTSRGQPFSFGVIDNNYFQCWLFFSLPYPSISVTVPKTKEDEGKRLLTLILGFLALKSKDLQPDEKPSFLYFGQKKSIGYIKMTPPSTPPQPDPIKILRNIIESKLRKLIRSVPNDESEIQDHIEDILNIRDYEFHREIIRIPQGTRSTIPDFTLDGLDIALEVKFCSKQEYERTILEEINADITSYRSKYSKILFVVYDIGIIRDATKYVTDIEKNENVYCSIIKN